MPKPTENSFEAARDRAFEYLEAVIAPLGCQVTVTITPPGFYETGEGEGLASPAAADADDAPKLDKEWFDGATKVAGIAPFALGEQVTVQSPVASFGMVIGVMHLLEGGPRFLVRFREGDDVRQHEEWFRVDALISGWQAEGR